MQATLELDADVLAAAEEISVRTQQSAGKVLSDLARKALTMTKPSNPTPTVINGFDVIPAEGRIVTDDMVKQLMEESE